METSLTFIWDDADLEAIIVENYTISISPDPPYNPSLTGVSSPWNVTLEHNSLYTVSIKAENCAGESEAFTLTYEISK